MTRKRYSAAAMGLHWILAVLLAFQLSLGWRIEDMPRGAAAFTAFQLHKSVGMLILALTIARLALRLSRRRPAPMADGLLARRLASAVHAGLYAVMLGAPLTGWALVSTARVKVPTVLFGIIPLPHLPLPAGAGEPADAAHGALAFLGVLLFLLHVAGALRHQFVKDENILGRMMPGLAGARVPKARSAFAVLITLGAVGGGLWAAKAISFGAPAQPVAAASPDVPVTAPMAGEPVLAGTETASEAVEASAAAEEPVPPAAWTIAPGSRLGFTARMNGEAIVGRFGSWTGAIVFDPLALDASSIRVTIDLASASTEDGQRDTMLQGSDFFDTAAHPRAVFASRTIRALGGNRYAADGTLSLHGMTRPVALGFTVDIADTRARAKGTATIDRTRFGVGSGEWAATDQIAAEVAIDFEITARRKP